MKTRQNALDFIAKDFGVVRFAKIVIRDNDACNVTEAEFTKAITDHGKRLHPGDRA